MGGRRWAEMILGTVALTLLLAWVSPRVSAYEFYETDEGEPLRWFRSGVQWTLSANVPGEVAIDEVPGLVGAAVGSWLDTGCKLPSMQFGGTSTATRATHPANHWELGDNLLVFIRSSSEWQNSGNSSTWVAITKIAYDPETGRIVDADVEINDGGFQFSTSATRSTGEVDLRSVLVHEYGHFFGLDHSREPSAIMFATYYQDESPPLGPGSDDAAGICAIYESVPDCVPCGTRVCGVTNCEFCGDCVQGEVCEDGVCVTGVCASECEGLPCGSSGCEGCACDDGVVCIGDGCGAGFEISSVSPIFGFNDRATSVAVGGAGFVTGMQVELGMIRITSSVRSQNLITATVPAGLAPGAYPVRVTTASGVGIEWSEPYSVLAGTSTGGQRPGCSSGAPSAICLMVLLGLWLRKRTIWRLGL